VGKVQRAPSAGPPSFKQIFKKNFHYSENLTSGYQTLECFIATLLT